MKTLWILPLLLPLGACNRTGSGDALEALQYRAVGLRFFLNDVDYYCLSHQMTGDSLQELCEDAMICFEGPEGWLQFSGNPFHPGCMSIRSPWFIFPESFSSSCSEVAVTFSKDENYYSYYLCFGELNCSEGFPMEFTLWWPGPIREC